MERYNYFQRFHPISVEEYNLFASRLKIKTFQKDELIVVPGQIQKELFFVNSGVQMSFFETDTKVHVQAFTYCPNLCAIPESFTLQRPAKYYLKCLTDSEMQYLTFEELQHLFDQSQLIERLFRKITEFVLAGILERHIELHSLSMKERYLAFCRRSPHLLQLVPHKYIASYLGMDATNFSKLYNTVKF